MEDSALHMTTFSNLEEVQLRYLLSRISSIEWERTSIDRYELVLILYANLCLSRTMKRTLLRALGASHLLSHTLPTNRTTRIVVYGVSQDIKHQIEELGRE
jgi:hypothetical protein